jgi:hypothetical protein
MSTAKNFYECSYTYQRGEFRGTQCCKCVEDIGFCNNCINRDRFKDTRFNVNLLLENILADNDLLIQKCMDELSYTSEEILFITDYLKNEKLSVEYLSDCFIKSHHLNK